MLLTLITFFATVGRSKLSDVVNWVIAAFKYVGSYIDAYTKSVNRTFSEVSADIARAEQQADNYTKSVYDFAISIQNYLNSDLVPYVEHGIATLNDDINSLRSWTQAQLNALRADYIARIASLLAYIIGRLLPPIIADVAKALLWIATEGAQLVNILLNAENLLTYLEGIVAKLWLWAAKQFAAQLTELWFKSMFAALPDMISIAEDTISDIVH